MTLPNICTVHVHNVFVPIKLFYNSFSKHFHLQNNYHPISFRNLLNANVLCRTPEKGQNKVNNKKREIFGSLSTVYGLVYGVRGRECFVGMSIWLVYGLWSHPEFSLDGLVQGLEFERGRECIVGLSLLLVYRFMFST